MRTEWSTQYAWRDLCAHKGKKMTSSKILSCVKLRVSVRKVSVSIIGKNLVWKVSPIPLALLITKSIGDTDIDTQKVSPIVSLSLPIIDINNHGYCNKRHSSGVWSESIHLTFWHPLFCIFTFSHFDIWYLTFLDLTYGICQLLFDITFYPTVYTVRFISVHFAEF